MTAPASPSPRGVALVDGDAVVRRERLLMLRAEHFDVRAYATCAAVLADASARGSACLVADSDMPEMAGAELVRAMRSSGWRGRAILLGDGTSAPPAPATGGEGDLWLPRTSPDPTLLAAVRAAGARQ